MCKSSDRGLTWTKISGQTGNFITPAPGYDDLAPNGSPQKTLIMLSGLITRSTDGGASWVGATGGAFGYGRPVFSPRYATDGIGPDLMEAARDALRRMIEWLGREHGLEPVQAYLLCSVAVDLRISEIVDVPNFVVTAHCPLGIFG